MTFDYWRPRIITALALAEGAKLPKGYGAAWWLPFSQSAYCLPIPFNRIVGAFRNWYLEWRRPCEDDPIAIAYDYAFSKGKAQGRREGEEQTHRLYGALLHRNMPRTIQ